MGQGASWALAAALAALALFGGAAFAAPLLVDRVAFIGAWLDMPHRDKPEDAERIWLDRPGGVRLESWLFRPEGAARGRTPALLYFHGNAELIDHNVGLARAYGRDGYAVLLAEYRGFGRSGGAPSSQHLPGDAEAFFDLLAAQPGIDPQRIVVVGRSLGGAAAAAVAEQRRPCALVLESTFASLGDMVAEAGLPPAFAAGRLQSRAAVERYPGPVLVLHGQTDEVIPFRQGERLAQAARQRADGFAHFVTFPGGHNPMAPFAAIQGEVAAFLERHTACGR